jgi:hypothetical protein
VRDLADLREQYRLTLEGLEFEHSSKLSHIDEAMEDLRLELENSHKYLIKMITRLQPQSEDLSTCKVLQLLQILSSLIKPDELMTREESLALLKDLSHENEVLNERSS